ncbi:sulfur carrier protein ThiS [Faecalicatena contorta]|uniref:sulfur carrier protein ThiS n=1 Tax=Lachnospiraceae TaxID=186803 RepID=UPI001F3036D8|nr:sulfur carrier protein ThiS [Faecalicatena contorta]MCF2668187.1 sulfur carrier protein ThiS [Faecalicatena contorta]MCI6536011.1 sulfur carrier protein ThiS [Lachnospiraceae bacterium]MDY2614701.1 sulfur carrier protein ThiS [Lachnospiraceae bacterium]MDY4207459.1 sulfur carrier protein ThiS [Lachnospiraceae bacterium]
MITVNGQAVSLEKPITVAEYLAQNQYRIERIAVEMNGEILPKKNYAAVTLKDGDKLEVVSFVGGG